MFLSTGWAIESSILHNIDEFQSRVLFPHDSTVLGLGPIKFLDKLQSCLSPHCTVFLFAVDVAFDRIQQRDLSRRYAKWSIAHASLGLSFTVISHADCGGVTSASHYICFWNAGHDHVINVPCVARCLGQMVNAAEKSDGRGWWAPLDAPPDWFGPHMRTPLMDNGLLQCEGLWDVHNPLVNVARPCIFKSMGWACGGLLAIKFLHAFDLPLVLFAPILTGNAS
jgi:hypothetical protein